MHAVSSEIARRIGDLTRLDVDFEETLHGAGFFDKLVLDLSRGSGIDRCQLDIEWTLHSYPKDVQSVLETLNEQRQSSVKYFPPQFDPRDTRM